MEAIVMIISSSDDSDTDRNSDTENFVRNTCLNRVYESCSETDSSLPDVSSTLLVPASKNTNYTSINCDHESIIYHESKDEIIGQNDNALETHEVVYHNNDFYIEHFPEKYTLGIENSVINEELPGNIKKVLPSCQSTICSSQLPASQESVCSSNSDTITVIIEESLSEEKGFEDLRNSLETAKSVFSIEGQPIQGSVFWRDSSHLGLAENQILVYLNCYSAVHMVARFKDNSESSENETFLSHALKTHNIYPKSKITYIVFGMEKYFQAHKVKEVRAFHGAVAGLSQSQPCKNRRNKSTLPYITRVDFDEAMIDVQLQVHVNLRLIDSMTDLAQIILSFSKSVKEAPNKRAKRSHGFSWHLHGDSTETVKVGKNPDGLYELWVQQLLQFHQVSKDTAQAIAAKYSSPQALMKAYHKCTSTDEASKLLQNIEVRRGIGPLATSRRVGPELSFKIYTLFTTRNPAEVLHTM